MTKKDLSGKTAQEATQSARYTTVCCDIEMLFEKGKTFQRCPKCESLTSWTLVELSPKKAA